MLSIETSLKQLHMKTRLHQIIFFFQTCVSMFFISYWFLIQNITYLSASKFKFDSVAALAPIHCQLIESLKYIKMDQ